MRSADSCPSGHAVSHVTPRAEALGGLAPAHLCSLSQGAPAPPRRAHWHPPWCHTLPGFAHAPPGSFLLMLWASPRNITSSKKPSLLSSMEVTPPTQQTFCPCACCSAQNAECSLPCTTAHIVYWAGVRWLGPHQTVSSTELGLGLSPLVP